MNILVTGGTGYIGSHTCVALLEEGHKVIIADNLKNSKVEVIERIQKITNKKVVFHKIDVTDYMSLEDVFLKHEIDGVIHFAGIKAIGESIIKPIIYYYNNVLSTLTLAELCLKYGVKKFVFSSSATVYGNNKSPFKETMDLLPTTNPYGETKAMSERILIDIAKANSNFSVSLLRYFNPVGAHKSGYIGDSPNGVPNNLMPYIAKVAKGKLKRLKIFGNDYPTVDGTGVRDYIHVVDLSLGHVAALRHQKQRINIYNLGTGKGTSVLELVHTFEEVNNVKVPYEIVERRQGDLAICYADTYKACQELGWTAQFDISDMCRDTWRFEQQI